MVRICSSDLYGAGARAGFGEQQRLGKVMSHEEIGGRFLAEHDPIHSRRVAELIGRDKKVGVFLEEIELPRFQIGLFGNLLADRHRNRLPVRHYQFRFIQGRPFRNLAQDDCSGDGRGIMQVMSAGEVEDRFAQFRRAPDRFIHRIETRDTTKKNVIPLGVTDRVEDQPAERDGNDQIVELVPVKPVGRRCGDLYRAEFTPILLYCSDSDGIGRIVLQLDALRTLDDRLMPRLVRSPRPPGGFRVFDIVGVGRKFRHDRECRWISCRGFSNQDLITNVGSIPRRGSPLYREASPSIVRRIEDMDF